MSLILTHPSSGPVSLVMGQNDKVRALSTSFPARCRKLVMSAQIPCESKTETFLTELT